jgi:hypothetical protein
MFQKDAPLQLASYFIPFPEIKPEFLNKLLKTTDGFTICAFILGYLQINATRFWGVCQNPAEVIYVKNEEKRPNRIYGK